MNLIHGKWKTRILLRFRHGPVRLGELSRILPLASKKMLAQHLREMERDGLWADAVTGDQCNGTYLCSHFSPRTCRRTSKSEYDHLVLEHVAHGVGNTTGPVA
ncbi:winged helix-turn-helix transcriptional regulator [Edaphobacter sp. HDX4]